MKNCGQAAIHFQFAIDDRHQHVGADRDPDVGLHRVLAGAEERQVSLRCRRFSRGADHDNRAQALPVSLEYDGFGKLSGVRKLEIRPGRARPSFSTRYSSLGSEKLLATVMRKERQESIAQRRSAPLHGEYVFRLFSRSFELQSPCWQPVMSNLVARPLIPRNSINIGIVGNSFDLSSTI